MTWSISASGTKKEVHEKLEATSFDNISDEGEKREACAARHLALTVCDATEVSHVTISASGSKGGSIVFNVSRWNQDAVVKPPDAG